MYKDTEYGTKERALQDIEHARKKFELAVRGLVHTICELSSVANDVEFLCEAIEDLNELSESYKYRVQEYNKRFGEDE